ncbi:MAG: nucleotidyltransferase domain-containing protein [Candidatus Pacearchaeota archaeon]
MSEHKEKNENSVEQSLAKDYIPKSKLGNLPISNQVGDSMRKEMDQIQKEIDVFKTEINKKFNFIESIGILPAQSSKKIEEEYEISEEDAKRGLIHIAVIIPEKHFKNIGQIRIESINIAKKINNKFWVHIITPVDYWNLGLDSKFEVMEAIAMSLPIQDKAFFGAIRAAQIHKSLVLKKFEKYVTSYVISGSLTRGEATKSSDVDVFIIIDDTDVKRMPRLELKEKLRSIIWSYIPEAQAIAGVKNILNVQIYLMTEFWDSVKEAHPVMFTFIRDGIPLYDRGAFLPWKSLLRMGKIKPTPEAIDMFMASGNKLEENINRRLMDIAVLDIYWGVLTPSQGVLMLFGLAPPTPKETIRLIREVFYEKEKILEEKYVKIIEKIVMYYKDYEHGKHKKISGKELDEMSKDAIDYMKRLRELREQIEKRVSENSIEEIYKNVFGMLENILKKKEEASIIKEFDKQLVKGGKFPPRYLENLKYIAKTRKAISETKGSKKASLSNKHTKEVDKARIYASEIINTLIEHSQRCEFLSLDRTRFIIKSKEMQAEIFFLGNTFIVQQNKIQKIVEEKIVDSNAKELQEEIVKHKNKETKIDFKSLDILKKVFGEFELTY